MKNDDNVKEKEKRIKSAIFNNKNSKLNPNDIKFKKIEKSKYPINHKSISNSKNESKRPKSEHKMFSSPEILIYNMNLLIDKMNNLKKMMYKTSDLKSMLVMDKYGLKYSNNIRKNINSNKKLMTPVSSKTSNIFKKFESSKTNNFYLNKTYFKKREANKLKINKTKKKSTGRLFNIEKEFDLTNNCKNLKEKLYSQTFLDLEKKNKKLYHLKTELFLLQQKNKIADNDAYVKENIKTKNLTFVRENIGLDKYYSKIKSKYMNNKLKYNRDKKRGKTTTSFKDILPDKTNSMIQIKIHDIDDEITEIIKPNKKIMFLKDNNNINSYNTRKRPCKSGKITKNRNFFNEDPKNKYLLKTPSNKSPNLSTFNKSINPKVPVGKGIKKQSFTFITNSNNSQDNTSYNSLNSSIKTSDILHSLSKNNKIIEKFNQSNSTSKSKYPSNQSNQSTFIKTRKGFLINKLKNIINNSNRIHRNFMQINEMAKDKKEKIFSKHDYSIEPDDGIDIKKINKFFKFSNREEVDAEKIVKENANKVKNNMDKRCNKILDSIINELFFEENRLNKKYYGLSSYEKKIIKIKRDEYFKKLSNESVLLEKKLEREHIMSMFSYKDADIIKLLKEKKVTLMDQIDELYFKYKALKYFNSKNEDKK